MSTQNVITGEAARRYAQALLDLAEETKSLKVVEKDLKTVKSLFENSEDLRGLISNPAFANSDKVAALDGIAKKAGISGLVSQFLGVVAQNNRAHEIPMMVLACEDELAKRRASQVAYVTSAVKLTAAQLTALKAELKTSLGQVVDIETDVDPNLLGGFVVKIGSRLYDSSLKTQIEEMKLALKSA